MRVHVGFASRIEQSVAYSDANRPRIPIQIVRPDPGSRKSVSRVGWRAWLALVLLRWGVAERELLPGEAARMTGYSTQMIRWLVDHGRLPARRGPGGVRLIPREAVERLARERTVLEQRACDLERRISTPDVSRQDGGSATRYPPACASVRRRW